MSCLSCACPSVDISTHLVHAAAHVSPGHVCVSRSRLVAFVQRHEQRRMQRFGLAPESRLARPLSLRGRAGRHVHGQGSHVRGQGRGQGRQQQGQGQGRPHGRGLGEEAPLRVEHVEQTSTSATRLLGRPASRVEVELAAGVRYGIHRYRFHSGDAVLYFRNAKVRRVEAAPPATTAGGGVAGGVGGMAGSHEGSSMRGSSTSGSFTNRPCILEGSQRGYVGAGGPAGIKSYAIFFHAQLNAACNVSTPPLDAALRPLRQHSFLPRNQSRAIYSSMALSYFDELGTVRGYVTPRAKSQVSLGRLLTHLLTHSLTYLLTT